MNITLPKPEQVVSTFKEACFEDIAVIVSLNRWMNLLSDPAVESRHSKILLTATIFVEILQCESFKQRSVIKIQTHINKRLCLDVEHMRQCVLRDNFIWSSNKHWIHQGGIEGIPLTLVFLFLFLKNLSKSELTIQHPAMTNSLLITCTKKIFLT